MSVRCRTCVSVANQCTCVGHRAKYRGGEGSLKSSAWEVLKHNPEGLEAKELVGQIDKLGEYSIKDISGVSS